MTTRTPLLKTDHGNAMMSQKPYYGLKSVTKSPGEVFYLNEIVEFVNRNDCSDGRPCCTHPSTSNTMILSTSRFSNPTGECAPMRGCEPHTKASALRTASCHALALALPTFPPQLFASVAFAQPLCGFLLDNDAALRELLCAEIVSA